MSLLAQQHDKVNASIANNASNKQWNSCVTSAVLFNMYIFFSHYTCCCDTFQSYQLLLLVFYIPCLVKISMIYYNGSFLYLYKL